MNRFIQMHREFFLKIYPKNQDNRGTWYFEVFCIIFLLFINNTIMIKKIMNFIAYI